MLIRKVAYWYLVTYTMLFVIVHLLGASGIRVVEYSRNGHLTSLMLSFLLLIGFFYRDRWAFRLGVLFYGFHMLSFPFEVYERYDKEKIVDFYGVGDWLVLVTIFIIVYIFAKKSPKHVEKAAKSLNFST